MIDTALAALQKNLRENHSFLHVLLQAEKTLPDIPEDVSNIQWEILPTFYYASLPRRSFRLTTPTDIVCLLKINMDTEHIRREGLIYQWLSKQNNTSLTVPRLIDIETNLTVSDQKSCGWFLTEWVQGQPASKIPQKALVPLLSKNLAHLHSVPVTPGVVDMLYGTDLPEINTVSEHLRLQCWNHFDIAIKACRNPDLKDFLLSFQSEANSHLEFNRISIIHGDLHLENIIFQNNNPNEKKRIILVDWEDIALDHPLSDLGHMLLYVEFSPTALTCLDNYLTLMNNKLTNHAPLIALDAWFYAALWFSRRLQWELHWNQQDKQPIEEKAIQIAEKLLSGMANE